MKKTCFFYSKNLFIKFKKFIFLNSKKKVYIHNEERFLESKKPLLTQKNSVF